VDVIVSALPGFPELSNASGQESILMPSIHGTSRHQHELHASGAILGGNPNFLEWNHCHHDEIQAEASGDCIAFVVSRQATMVQPGSPSTAAGA